MKKRQFELLDSVFGQDLDYFKNNPGRPGLFKKQLMKKISFSIDCSGKYARLSYMLNHWLDVIPALNVSSSVKSRMEACTWQFVKPNVFRCRLSICPWCRTKKLMKAHALFKQYTHLINGMITRDWIIKPGEDTRKTVFRAPEHKTCILSIRGLQVVYLNHKLFYAPTAVYYIAEETEGYLERQGVYGHWNMNTCIQFQEHLIVADAARWMQENRNIKNITVSKQNVTRNV